VLVLCGATGLFGKLGDGKVGACILAVSEAEIPSLALETKYMVEVLLDDRALGTASGASSLWRYFDSFVIASAALPATTQLADPATTASSSNQRNPKSSMHSGKSGLMMMYPGMTAPGM